MPTAARFPPCRLQRSQPAPGEEPHAFVSVAAVDNIDAVTHDRVMKCSAAVLGNELEEGLPPGIISEFEHFFPDAL